MKKERNHSVDNLFLESLGGHQIEPSPGIWESLASYIPSSGGRGIFLYLVSGVLIGAFTFLMHANLQTAAVHMAETIQVPAEEIQDIVSSDTQNESSTLNEIAIEENNYKQTTSSSGTNSSLGLAPEQAAPPPANSGIIPFVAAEPEAGFQQGNTGTDLRATYDFLDRADLISGQVETNSTMGFRESQERECPDPIFNLNIKDNYVKKADVLFGAGFSPAVNIYPEGQNRNDFSLELIAAYEKSRFIVESGVGVNYTSESAEYRINYSSYDSVGYYVGVNSFTVDPENPDLVIFETHLKSVYDSIDHFRIRENTNKFVYLQIPLRVGYRVLQANRFSIDLKAGILFSFQVYKDVPGVPYQGSDAEEIEVIRQYPDRLTTSWQYTAAIGINYQINNKVRFTLEPFYRQYIKSAYSPSSAFPARSPHAFGIRGGLYFHF